MKNTRDPLSAFGSEALANHFVTHCSHLYNSRQVNQCVYENIKLEILWKGPRFHAINLQQPRNVPFVPKKEGTFLITGIKIG